MPDVDDMPEDLPEWASAGAYSAPGEPWDGQSRLNDGLMPSLAAAGLIPAVPTDAPGFNSWLRRVWEHLQTASSDLWGSRYTGDVTVSSDVALSADVHADVFTIDPGVVVDANGWRIFATRTVLGAGAMLHANGADGAPGLVGGPGAGGASRAAGTTGATSAGGDGGDVGDPGDPGTDAVCRLGSLGGDGGEATPQAAGARGNGARPTFAQGRAQDDGSIGHVHQAIAGRALDGTIFTGGSGGGGGAANAGRGGGGGAGGGVLILVSREVVNDGTICARGGDGGAAFNATGAGGGGGGGGAVVLVTHVPITGSGTIDAAGGAGGVGGTPGSANGDDGDDGSDGVLYLFAM